MPRFRSGLFYAYLVTTGCHGTIQGSFPVMFPLLWQNRIVEAAPGQFGERSDQTFQYTIRYKGRLQQPEEFENIVIKSLPDGEVLRLKDIAEIQLDRLGYKLYQPGRRSQICDLYRIPDGRNQCDTNHQ